MLDLKSIKQTTSNPSSHCQKQNKHKQNQTHISLFWMWLCPLNCSQKWHLLASDSPDGKHFLFSFLPPIFFLFSTFSFPSPFFPPMILFQCRKHSEAGEGNSAVVPLSASWPTAVLSISSISCTKDRMQCSRYGLTVLSRGDSVLHWD